MGFLKDLSTVSRMGREVQRQMDVPAQLAGAQAAMASANATMAAMTARATSTAAVNGTPGTATVITVRRTGQVINMAHVVELELLVRVPGRLPAPVTITEIVDPLYLVHAVPGAALPVRVGDLTTDVFVDWSRAS